MWKWILAGALIGTFLIHPFVMIVSQFMNEPSGGHVRSLLDIIVRESMIVISPKMTAWNLSFAFLGSVSGLFFARSKQKTKELQNSEKKFRSVTMSATDAIISINNSGKIIFWNRAAQKIFGYGENEIIGELVTILMPERYREAHRKGMENLGLTDESNVLGQTVELQGMTKGGTEFPLELSLSSWGAGAEKFYTGIIRNISGRKKLEQEKEDLILDLKDALASVKKLTGLLPICSFCKKIRDDEGYWQQVEKYIHERSEAEFSHGICPDCAKKHYPDLNLK